MKILVLTKYSRKGASSRLRTLQYLPYLEKQGFEFTVQNLFDDIYLERLYNSNQRSKLNIIKHYSKRFIYLLNLKKYDLIWIEYEIFPYLPPIVEQYLNFIGMKYIVDYDDAIFHNYDLSNHIIIRKALSNKIDTVMASSSCVISGNSYIFERAKNAGSKCIEFIPTVVDIDRYKISSKSQGSTYIIGWIGSPTTQKYLLEIREALVIISKKYDIKLLLIGASSDIKDLLPNIDIEVVPWNESNEANLIGQMDIGIMPLIDSPWERGKCGYKLIQYMACGIPVIASPVGENVNIVSNSNSGYLASNTNEWVDCLDKLITSHKTYNSFSLSGRKAVETFYSVQSQVPKLTKIIASLN